MTGLAIGVMGVGGRMGGMVVRQVGATEGCAIVAGGEHPDSSALETDIGTLAGLPPLGVVATADRKAVFAASDVVVDFTLPESTVANAAEANASGTAMVIGTTGLSNEQEEQLRAAAKTAPIVYAPNMSLGVNLLFALVKRVAATLDEDFDIEVVEMHHNRKVDAPSGTALGLGRAAAAGRSVPFDDVAVLSREGHTGARTRGEIGFATLRGGDVVGDHTVVFAGPGERIELTHKAAGRELFASGAVRAALWTPGRAPGLYSMADVLGLD
jgi:4-hydroxy-tetrahydrodipicolinate reductase